MSGWVLPVLVGDWELGCCGGPLGIGDRVTWSLLFSDVLDEAVGPLVEATWTVTPVPTGPPGWTACALTAGAATATWTTDTGRALPTGRQFLPGHLIGSWHGGGVVEDLPTTTGRVERIRAASQRYELVPAVPADRSWMRTSGVPGYFVAVPGSTELADVGTAPGPEATEAGPARGATSYRGSAGWVVDLAVER